MYQRALKQIDRVTKSYYTLFSNDVLVGLMCHNNQAGEQSRYQFVYIISLIGSTIFRPETGSTLYTLKRLNHKNTLTCSVSSKIDGKLFYFIIYTN